MSRQIIKLTVNGDAHEIAVAPHQTLLEVLRDELGLTGTKRGCTSGQCGVCTVQQEDGDAVLSCLALAVEWDGRAVTTIEGIAEPGRTAPGAAAFPGIRRGAVRLLHPGTDHDGQGAAE